MLRGYTYRSAAYLFLRIVEPDRARALMTRMLPQVLDRRAVGRTSRRRQRCTSRSPTTGLAALGVPEAVLDSFPEEFREGMAARAERLGDRGPSAPEHWEPGLGTGEAHVLVTVYAADERAARRGARRRCAASARAP